MARKLAKKKLPAMTSEAAVDRWLQDANLDEYFSGDEFEKVRFAKLEQTILDERYHKALESQPVTLRLPKSLIHKMKLLAIREEIPYQTLVRIILQKEVIKELKR